MHRFIRKYSFELSRLVMLAALIGLVSFRGPIQWFLAMVFVGVEYFVPRPVIKAVAPQIDPSLFEDLQAQISESETHTLDAIGSLRAEVNTLRSIAQRQPRK